MVSSVSKKKSFFNGKMEESKILVAYRFISLTITTAFYVVNYSEHELIRKIIIILCLLVSSVILSYLYPTYETSQSDIKLLIVIETIGNTLILIPTGGIESPFIWYSLNTILICFVFLKRKYGWINFLVYLLSYGIIIVYFTDTNADIKTVVADESNLFLSLIMIIIAVQFLVASLKTTKKNNRRLEEINEQLKTSNKMLLESIEHIKDLYQSVNILSNQGNKEGIIKLLFEHIKKITGTDTVFYYDITDNSNKMISYDNNYILSSLEEYIEKNLKIILESANILEVSILNSKFLIAQVGRSYETYGLLGMKTVHSTESSMYKNNYSELLFLSGLLSSVFERLKLEEITEGLLITEEQNRIANELHDSVLQRLFSLSCGMYTTIKNINSYNENEITKELNEFREILDFTMKELREKIYGLSWKKSGNSSFAANIKKYIEDIKKLNQVNIPFSVRGNMEVLSAEQEKAIYRMICEGIGNAVRHGKAKNIEIVLDISSNQTVLSISDDGAGFDLKKAINESKGMGMRNLKQLTESLRGEININTVIDNGTKLEILLPMIKGGL
mgnify:CR=1 FL=1|jgi:signal transduction histidine kinase